MACVRKRGDGYRVDWRDKKGNRYRKTFELRKDAETFAATVTVAKKDGTYVAPKDVPTLRAVAERWFENKRAQLLRPSTLSGYRRNLDCHILKADFADARLDTIDVGGVQDFRRQLSEKRIRGGGVLKPVTINYILRDLEAVFGYAMASRLASWNPASCVDRIKLDTGEVATDEEQAERTDIAITEDEVLSPTDCRKLIDAAPEGFARAFLMTAVMTGARHDELLALQWRDVSFDPNSIRIRRSLSWAKLPGEPTRPRFFAPKTKRGNRVLPCPAELALTLKKWRLQCPKGELGLLFPSEAGEPLHRSHTLDCVLRPALEAAGLPARFHMHSLRHSFCSQLLAQGTPPTEVQNYSGHKRLSTLLDIYSHFIPSEQTGSIEVLAAKVLG